MVIVIFTLLVNELISPTQIANAPPALFVSKSSLLVASGAAVWKPTKVGKVGVVPLEEATSNIDGFEDIQSRLISGTYEDINNIKVRIISAYIPNGQSLDSEKFIYKKNWLDHFHKYLKNLQLIHKNIILTGDFNIAPEDIDCHDPEVWRGKNLVSDIEREYFKKILRLGLTDSFRYMNPDNLDFSWWDYRIPLKRNLGMRIDHVLISDSILGNLKKAYIDKKPRQLERPSDHTPVIAELQ